jgi:carbonic anhydrase
MRNRWMTPLLVITLALPAETAAAQTSAPPAGGWRTPWSYDEGAKGPAHWGKLDSEYAACGAGRAQSPVDIASATKAALPALRFAYKNGPVKIINNGYTAVRVNYPPGNGNFLYVGDTRYELTQFHFHHPSEEYLYGKPSAMAAHFMHVSSDGKVLGVAVMLNAGAANPVVQRLWDHMPPAAGAEHEIAGLEADPGALLPHELGYFTYSGSQTAPPCTEGVTWIVLKAPMEVSAAQIEKFAKLYPHDVRPVQPLNGRVIKESP